MATSDKARDAAIAEAQFDAYIEDIAGDTSKKAAVIANARHDEADLQTFVDDSRNADKVPVYNQLDGTRSDVLISMLSKQLRKRFPKSENIERSYWGKRAFALEPPANLPEAVRVLCPLHPQSPERERMNEAGLQGIVCYKANMPSPVEATLHFNKKHARQKLILGEYEARRDREEDRDLRRAEVAAMRELAARATITPTEPVAEPVKSAKASPKEE